MRIGKLRHRIVIERIAETQDLDGAPIESWSAWAAVAPMPSIE